MRTADGYIINKCLNGDKAAFGLLVDKYKEGVYALAYSKLGNFHDAEDVAQEVFIKAYRKLHTLKHYDSFHAWLYATTSNLCKDWIRARIRRPDDEYIEDEDPKILEVLSIEDYREKAAQRSLHESLEEALESLPEMHRQVLTLYYLAGMSGKEIARFLGIAPMTAWQRLSRARSQLRKEMVAMMDTAFEGKRLPGGFTLRIVEAIKRIKIQPMPRTTGLPWGLSLAAGIIVTVLSLNPHVSMTSDIAMAGGSPLSAETKVLETGEIAVDILKTPEVLIIAGKQGDGDNGSPGPQNTFSMAPRAGEGTWTRKADMPTARSNLSTSVVDGMIYAFGGSVGTPKNGHSIASVVAYDPAADNWVDKADMLSARAAFSTSVVDGVIYAIGGMVDGDPFTNFPLTTVEAYDPVKNAWEKKADMPTARYYLSTSVVDGMIYAIGGYRGDGGPTECSAVEAYNPATDTWTPKADMPDKAAGLSTSVVDGIIYAIGGVSNSQIIPTVEAYDPERDIWIPKADMPTPRMWLSTSVVDGMIYAFGGWVGEANIVTPVTMALETYNPANDKWMIKGDMPMARCVLSTSTVDGKVYAIGGYTAAEVVTDLVEEFDPGFPSGGKSVAPTNKQPTKWGEIK
jgi:RNA polymerase sigma factor (sigma-70 family)